MALTSRKSRRPAKRPAKARRSKATKPVKRGKPGRSPSRSSSDIVEAALAAFAHEVRTPLTGILAVSDLLATSDLGERERRWVDTIKAGAEHLASLPTLFVDAARSRHVSQGGRQDLFDLRALARNAGDSLSGRATAKGLRSAVEISDKLPVFVTGDPVRLRAALENLIDNAVKFTERGDVVLKATTARGPKGKVAVTFAVSDSGIGLTLAEIRRLFKPFSQANVSIASRFGGAGLGLSSVKQLARAMGGDVTVGQRRGGGTTFTFTVLLAVAKYYSPSGKAIQDNGVSPTYMVTDSPEPNPDTDDEDVAPGPPEVRKDSEDNVLKKAIEVSTTGKTQAGATAGTTAPPDSPQALPEKRNPLLPGEVK